MPVERCKCCKECGDKCDGNCCDYCEYGEHKNKDHEHWFFKRH